VPDRHAYLVAIRVVIVDDQAVVRAGLRAFLGDASDVHLVGEADTGGRALEVAARTRPDVVLSEARLPDLDGAELIRRLRDEHHHQARQRDAQAPRVVILTGLDHDRHVFACLRAGASGFLLKDTAPAELLRAVRVVADGAVVMSPTVTRRVVDHLLATLGVADPAASAALDRLTAREQDVLELVAHGLSNADIAARLCMSIGTVKAHVSRILTKLDLRDRVQAVILAYETGLVRAR
jgi:DNA-binding NarL/FixJ family response regulator